MRKAPKLDRCLSRNFLAMREKINQFRLRIDIFQVFMELLSLKRVGLR